jgi:acyl carrier protein
LVSALTAQGYLPMRITEPELLDIISKESLIERDQLKRDATLEDLGVSSMDVMTTLFELEERYDVTLEGSEMPPVKTLGELCDYLLSRINEEKPA